MSDTALPILPATLAGLPADPWQLFGEWYAAAQQQEINDPDAMALATVSAAGMPSLRMVLMKGFGKEGLGNSGIAFVTNTESRKGQQLAVNCHAALCLHWKSLRRQIRMEGAVERLSNAEADAYFASRSRQSRIGAWASQQSRVLDSREELEAAVRQSEDRFKDLDVPRPTYWGGYRLMPLMIEFWADGAFRLHDRMVYRRATLDQPWQTERLYP